MCACLAIGPTRVRDFWLGRTGSLWFCSDWGMPCCSTKLARAALMLPLAVRPQSGGSCVGLACSTCCIVLAFGQLHPFQSLWHNVQMAFASLRVHLQVLHHMAGASCGGRTFSVPSKWWLHQWHFQFAPHDRCSRQPSCMRLVALAPRVLLLESSAPCFRRFLGCVASGFLVAALPAALQSSGRLGCGWEGAAVSLLLCPLWARLLMFFRVAVPSMSGWEPVSPCCCLLWLPPAIALRCPTGADGACCLACTGSPWSRSDWGMPCWFTMLARAAGSLSPNGFGPLLNSRCPASIGVGLSPPSCEARCSERV